MLIVCCEVLAAVWGGAVYLGIGGGGYEATTSNTSVALTDCIMTNNTAGVIVNVSFALVCYAWLCQWVLPPVGHRYV